MRAGENVQPLFSSMLRSVKSADVESKKLTYFYLLRYSTHEPEQAIMAVNTFVQDSQDPNPFVRALAVRTMCRIRLENVAENMIVPLRKSLQDCDPYVRKTAAFGVSKLYDVIPEAVENAKLFDDLLTLLRDDNPMVVANTTASIFEINEKRTAPVLKLNSETIGPVLNAVNNCSEWCTAILFDALCRYVPESQEDATFLIDRLLPFLKHSNPSVVIGAFKCVFLFMDVDARTPQTLFPQIIPPFITLVTSAEPEVQYVVLRALSLFVQRYPRALTKEIRAFFCKYNDPSYVKMEKLDVIVTICRPNNAQLVLEELSEYCNAVDVSFVRKSVRAVGQIGTKIEEAARKCINILVALVQGKAIYAIEEAVCVICDLLRKYPGEFESLLNSVCANLDALKEARAEAAATWILGEYCALIDGIDVLMDPYLDSFRDEQPLVQLAILSSLVKIFCDKPDATRDQLQFVLGEATKPGSVPDVKNRALIYWRILSADVSLAKVMLRFTKATILHSGINFDPDVLAELIKNMGTVAGVLHVVPSDFVRRVKFVPEDEEAAEDLVLRNWHPLGLKDNTLVDLFADYDRQRMYLRMVSKSVQPLAQFQFAMNRNVLGVGVAGQAAFPEVFDFGDVAEVAIPISVDASQVGNPELRELQIAIRTNQGSIWAVDKIPAQIATTADGNISQDQFRQFFQSLPVAGATLVDDAVIADEKQLNEANVYVVGRNGPRVYVAFAFVGAQLFLAELNQDGQRIVVNAKGKTPALFPVIGAAARSLFAQK
jgi:hypothetical protein